MLCQGRTGCSDAMGRVPPYNQSFCIIFESNYKTLNLCLNDVSFYFN